VYNWYLSGLLGWLPTISHGEHSFHTTPRAAADKKQLATVR
jgi:hypothetical protein